MLLASPRLASLRLDREDDPLGVVRFLLFDSAARFCLQEMVHSAGEGHLAAAGHVAAQHTMLLRVPDLGQEDGLVEPARESGVGARLRTRDRERAPRRACPRRSPRRARCSGRLRAASSGSRSGTSSEQGARLDANLERKRMRLKSLPTMPGSSRTDYSRGCARPSMRSSTSARELNPEDDNPDFALHRG